MRRCPLRGDACRITAGPKGSAALAPSQVCRVSLVVASSRQQLRIRVFAQHWFATISGGEKFRLLQANEPRKSTDCRRRRERTHWIGGVGFLVGLQGRNRL